MVGPAHAAARAPVPAPVHLAGTAAGRPGRRRRPPPGDRSDAAGGTGDNGALGRLRLPVPAGGRARPRADHRQSRAGAAWSLAGDHRVDVGRHRLGRRARPPVHGGGSSVRHRRRAGAGGGGAVPDPSDVHSRGSVSRHLPPRGARPPGCGWSSRGGDPGGVRRPARRRGARGRTVLAPRQCRVDAAADHHGRRCAVRQAVRRRPPALRPVVQAGANGALRPVGGRAPIQLGAPPRAVRGPHAAGDARRRRADGCTTGHRRDHARA